MQQIKPETCKSFNNPTPLVRVPAFIWRKIRMLGGGGGTKVVNGELLEELLEKGTWKRNAHNPVYYDFGMK